MFHKTGGGAFFGGLNLNETPRERLVSALKASMTDEQARDTVDALEAYLEEGPGNSVLTLPNLTPDSRKEIKGLRAERDAAVALAEQALRSMEETLKKIRGE